MNRIKHIFDFSKKEQYAILLLLVIILLSSIFMLVSDQIFPTKHLAIDGLADSVRFFEHSITNTKHIRSETSSFDITDPDVSSVRMRLNPFPFNPNKMPAETWRELGLEDYQIRAIHNYEQKGGKFYSKADFAKMYTISEEEYAILEPYIRIPSLESHSGIPQKDPTPSAALTTNKTDSISKEAIFSIVDLNSADSTELMEIPGIGKWFAHRILKYRTALGGFIHPTQLLEVYGIDSDKYEQVIPYIEIDSNAIQQLKVNHLEFRELLQHPYLKYEQVKELVSYRERRGFITSDELFRQVVSIDDEIFGKLQPYLDYR
ncbi:MAG: helix-hairpin-helix domain-containing protein [Bacteroidales bacterium]|nr:helix-hairpin-helix domain-containing protein [Bacteroidales bacterium]MDD3700518.1 helix-hairpin-helix domain-containing protein [Bacteroidales bacterium]